MFILLQARMGSTRLPGKVLKPLAGKPQLQHIIDRLGTFAANIIVATSDLPGDDAIETFCVNNSLKFFRGSENDVLDRFYQAALKFNAKDNDILVRITADCPLHHAEVVQFALNEFEQHSLDYFSNSFAPLFEDGCDAEVFRFATLKKAHEAAKLLSQREHVTPYIKDSGLFLCGYKKFNADYHFKLSVDTPEDHAAVEEIFKTFAPRTDFLIHEIVKLVSEKPGLLAVNKNSVINAGYIKSLENDKEVN